MYTFTLTRAHKITERLQKLISDTESSVTTDLSPILFSYPSHLATPDNYKTKHTTAYNNLDLLLNLITLKTTLRNKIAEANQLYGINDKMAEINCNKVKLQLLHKIESLSKIDNNTIPAANLQYWIETMSKVSSGGDSSYVIKVIPGLMSDLYKTKIKELEKINFILNDTLSDLNKNTITIDLSDDIAELLGLK